MVYNFKVKTFKKFLIYGFQDSNLKKPLLYKKICYNKNCRVSSHGNKPGKCSDKYEKETF